MALDAAEEEQCAREKIHMAMEVLRSIYTDQELQVETMDGHATAEGGDGGLATAAQTIAASTTLHLLLQPHTGGDVWAQLLSCTLSLVLPHRLASNGASLAAPTRASVEQLKGGDDAMLARLQARLAMLLTEKWRTDEGITLDAAVFDVAEALRSELTELNSAPPGECPICLGPLSEPGAGHRTSEDAPHDDGDRSTAALPLDILQFACHHLVHLSCYTAFVDSWLRSHEWGTACPAGCPVCRHPLTREDTRRMRPWLAERARLQTSELANGGVWAVDGEAAGESGAAAHALDPGCRRDPGAGTTSAAAGHG